jgi:hypothetical protein
MAIVVAVGEAPTSSAKNGKIGKKTPKPVMPISTTPTTAANDPARDFMSAG